MGKWEAIGQSDDWFTPRYIMDALGEAFDLDVAAPKEGPRHVQAVRWLHEHSLDTPWHGFIWMNPPYGGRNALMPWVSRFIVHNYGLAILPDRTSAPWFAPIGRSSTAVLFVSRKVKFERPDGSMGDSPGNGSVIVACGSRARAALLRASSLGPTFLTVGGESV